MKKPWSGRFTAKTSKTAESFTESISFDQRLWKYDIEGSIAHAAMLGKKRIISRKDSDLIIKGLKQIADDIKKGSFRFSKELEDIHMNIEAALVKKIGQAGKKLHTARSRNDQVALDIRLYLRDENKAVISLIKVLQKTLVSAAEKNIDFIMPGYTHLQKAQPVLLAHHLLAYVAMLERDASRFEESLKRINTLPLGSCALAGTTFPIDRAYVAKALGFQNISGNSIDAVSDRDFAIEFLANSSILMMHLSRLAEEFILWSAQEFSFIEISDRFTTGSSIMPQKKNPDVAELIRGKTGAVYGNLMALLTLMKALPLSYNRDMQEDKKAVFNTVDTVKQCLDVFSQMLNETKFKKQNMLESAEQSYATATDIAEYLVKKGIPFREAHEITGKIVLYCIKNRKKLNDIALEEFKKFAHQISKDIYEVISIHHSVNSKASGGGTARSEVLKQIKKFKQTLK